MEKFLNIYKYFEYAVFIVINVFFSCALIAANKILELGMKYTIAESGSSPYFVPTDPDLFAWCFIFWFAFMFAKIFAITFIYCLKFLFPNVHKWLQEFTKNKKKMLLKVFLFDLLVNTLAAILAVIIGPNFDTFLLAFFTLLPMCGGIFISYVVFLIFFKILSFFTNSTR